ncbi:hypothetical protein RUM43_004375 [Polyplax serrata]|uniref:Uncharacterized protein n=1 Tax=Polyplax serrata TaxID=468196 RepID=A0AAN8SAS9_POLSC
MPGMPEEDSETNSFKPNGATVREITQTDHLNKKLLTSYLNNINMTNNSDKPSDRGGKNEEEEEQNWEP